MKSNLTYVFIHYDCYPFPVAKHLQDEGNKVIIAQLNSRSELRIPGLDSSEDPKDKKQRLSNYDGLLKKNTLPEVMTMLRNVKPADRDSYFIFFDFNDLYKVSEDIMKMGFRNGLFPTEYYYRMEKEREMSKAFVKKNYPDVKVADSFPFKKAEDGIHHIEDSKEIFVLKSNGNTEKTIVPKSDDPKVARAQLIEALKKNKQGYEKGGFLLEVKIPDCLEVTPVLVCYDGDPLYTLVEFENKAYGAGNIGAQKGGNQVVNIRTKMIAEINRIAFPPAVHELAKKQPGLSIYDAGLLWNGKDFYFTEFCAMRYGWDGIFAEMVMADRGKPFVSDYFEDMMAGIDPLKNKYGAALRLFNYEGDLEDTQDPLGDEPMTWAKSIESNLFLYTARKHEGEIVDTADRDFIAAVTAAGDSLAGTVKKLYERVGKFNFEKLYYRPEFDFLSKDYSTSIPNRIEAVKEFL